MKEVRCVLEEQVFVKGQFYLGECGCEGADTKLGEMMGMLPWWCFDLWCLVIPEGIFLLRHLLPVCYDFVP